MHKIILGIFALLVSICAAEAQTGATVKQSGNVTPGHAVMWTTNGIVQDAGPAASGNLTSLGVTAPGLAICQLSNAFAAGAWARICLGAANTGVLTIALDSGGGAPAPSLQFLFNGVATGFPLSIFGPINSATFLGNPTAFSANAQAFTVNGLTANISPDATLDYLVMWNHTTGTFQKVAPGVIASSATSGVSNINGVTGAIALGASLATSGSTLSVATNGVANANLAQGVANTVKGNFTNATANESDNALPSCSTTGQILQYTSGTGFTCSTASVAAPPQGRITLVSGVAVVTTDQVGATHVYYTSMAGKTVPIYNGTATIGYSICADGTAGTCEISITLGSSWVANALYDVYVGLSGGSATLCTGPSWTNSAAGTSTRGISSDPTALQVFNGYQTNKNTMTCRTGNAATISCSANQCTYLGSFLTSGSAGQIDLKFGTGATGGGAASISVCNYYNRVPIWPSVTDTTIQWGNPSGATFAALNASNGNRITVLSCLGDESIQVNLITLGLASAANTMNASIGLNSTSAAAAGATISFSPASVVMPHAPALTGVPSTGINFYQAIQKASNTASIFDGDIFEKFYAAWRY